MGLEDVKRVITESENDPEVQSFLADLRKPTDELRQEIVSSWLEGPEGKRKLQGLSDALAEKKKSDYLANHLEELVDKAYSEKHPPADPKLAAMEKELASLKKESARNELKALLVDNGLNSKFVDLFEAGDTMQKVELIKSILEEAVAPIRTEFEEFKAKALQPGGGGGLGSDSIEQWKKKSLSEKSKEYQKIQKEKGKTAADEWLQSIS